jgi:CDP-glycerol glycerophosphotransferase
MQFDVYLAADFLWLKLPRGARRVQTFHGVAGKYRTVYDSPSESMRSWDRLFFINQRRLRHFVESGAIDEGSEAARLIGMPKLDCLVDGTLKRDELLAGMGIDRGRKAVLYAPTWSPHSSVVSMGEALVQRLGEAGHAVIVKLHDRSRDLQFVNSGGVDWGARLEPLLKRYGGVLASGHNSSPYLAAADVMITDHSSVGFEYLLLDRPLVRIHVPELIKNTDIEPSYVELLASASTSVTNVGEVVAAVERGFKEPSENSSTRIAVANEMFYKPGTATERAVKELYDLMELAA